MIYKIMVKYITLKKLLQSFQLILNKVIEKKEEYIITENNIPIAKIIPIKENGLTYFANKSISKEKIEKFIS